MQICKVKNYQELSRKAANLIAAQIILKPDSVLGLATGSSPVGTYEHLVEMYENGDLDFSQVTTVNLDEYKGLAGSDEQSYRYFMNTHLFHKININHANTYVPNGTEPDAEKHARHITNYFTRSVQLISRSSGLVTMDILVLMNHPTILKTRLTA